jgi:hypothetical protein
MTVRDGPESACRFPGPAISSPAIDPPKTEGHKSFASEAPDPGRHHVGMLGDIISESLGDFSGVSTSADAPLIALCVSSRRGRDLAVHTLRLPRPLSALASSTRSRMANMSTLATNRATRASSSSRCAPCWGVRPWAPLRSPKRPA